MSFRGGKKSTVKKTIDQDEARRKREDQMVSIRKDKREASLQKRRNFGASTSVDSSQVVGGACATAAARLESLSQMVQGVWTEDPKMQLEATTQFRKLLSIEKGPPIDKVIDSGVVPRFVQFLQKGDYPQLQFEAAWALTNIASGTSDHTKVVIDHGAVPIFVALLQSPSDDVREKAVWALGNIAGDSYRCRDLVLQANALPSLLGQLNEHSKVSMLRNATWTLSNFCRGKPQPNFEAIKPALPTLAQLIHSSDEEVLADACWALTYLNDGASHDKIDAVVQCKVCPRLVELLMHNTPAVLIPALRTVGNIVTGNAVQTQTVIDCSNALPHLLHLLTDSTTGHVAVSTGALMPPAEGVTDAGTMPPGGMTSIKKEACWVISNITAGNQQQIQHVIDANVIPPLVQLLSTSEFDIKKEAAWAISNATSGGTHDQIKFLVAQGCIKPLCDLLACSDSRIVIVALEGLENILKVGKGDAQMVAELNGVNQFAHFVDEAEGLDKLDELQIHENNDIYAKALHIVKEYFGVDEDDENSLRPGMDANAQSYQFNADSQQGMMPTGGFNFAQGGMQ